jgi:DNA-binding response OmpR family regulator
MKSPDQPTSASVLVIDDDRAVLETITATFESYGICVATAHDGIEGLRLFRELQPAMVIIDIIMPEQDGIGAIMRMRRERPSLKIIAMSGGGRIGNSDFLTVAKKLGADQTIAKPFKSAALVAMVQKLVSQSASRDTAAEYRSTMMRQPNAIQRGARLLW